MESARTAQGTDVPRVQELARQATQELRPHRGGDIWSRREAHPEPIEAVIGSAVANDPDRHLVVGTIDDVIVGYGLAVLETLHDGECLAVVSDLYVEPDARGVGVGEAVMDQLIGWAQRRRAVGIDALALPGDRETKNFFERFGLTARAIVVHRSLSPGAGVPA